MLKVLATYNVSLSMVEKQSEIKAAKAKITDGSKCCVGSVEEIKKKICADIDAMQKQLDDLYFGE